MLPYDVTYSADPDASMNLSHQTVLPSLRLTFVPSWTSLCTGFTHILTSKPLNIAVDLVVTTGKVLGSSHDFHPAR